MSKTTWIVIGVIAVILIIAFFYNRNKNASTTASTNATGVVPNLLSRDDAPTTEQLRSAINGRGINFPSLPNPIPQGQIICIGGQSYWWSIYANNGQGGWVLGTGSNCKNKPFISLL